MLSAYLSLSPVTAQGGNLGWKRRDELNGVFAEAAFKLAKGKARRSCRARQMRAALTGQPSFGARAPQMTPQPIKTSFGYHLILVVRA